MATNDRPMVIYHGNCPDGFTAAWVARKALGPDCDFIPASYGQAPPDVAGRPVYILDFSYKRPVMLDIVSRTHRLVILDHHKTAQAELDGFADECIRAYGLIPPHVVFDMEKSGAMLAWDHFFPDVEPPWLIRYVEDRDLWRWSLAASREINAALASYPRTFEQWDHFGGSDLGHVRPWLASEGAAILRYQDQLVDSICRGAKDEDLAGYRVKVANTSVLFSEVAGRLAEGGLFGAAWFVRRDGKLQWSLRSRGDFDVSEIAKRFGGGGHRNAAGFETES